MLFQPDQTGGVDHPNGDTLFIGGEPRQIGLGADGGKAFQIDRGTVGLVGVGHSKPPVLNLGHCQRRALRRIACAPVADKGEMPVMAGGQRDGGRGGMGAAFGTARDMDRVVAVWREMRGNGAGGIAGVRQSLTAAGGTGADLHTAARIAGVGDEIGQRS